MKKRSSGKLYLMTVISLIILVILFIAKGDSGIFSILCLIPFFDIVFDVIAHSQSELAGEMNLFVYIFHDIDNIVAFSADFFQVLAAATACEMISAWADTEKIVSKMLIGIESKFVFVIGSSLIIEFLNTFVKSMGVSLIILVVFGGIAFTAMAIIKGEGLLSLLAGWIIEIASMPLVTYFCAAVYLLASNGGNKGDQYYTNVAGFCLAVLIVFPLVKTIVVDFVSHLLKKKGE